MVERSGSLAHRRYGLLHGGMHWVHLRHACEVQQLHHHRRCSHDRYLLPFSPGTLEQRQARAQPSGVHEGHPAEVQDKSLDALTSAAGTVNAISAADAAGPVVLAQLRGAEGIHFSVHVHHPCLR